jgi:hypothetical protein
MSSFAVVNHNQKRLGDTVGYLIEERTPKHRLKAQNN